MPTTLCSCCKQEKDREGQRYCRACHAAYMRANRPRHSELKPEAKMKANARAYANTYVKRGYLKPEPCECCGADKAEKHHEDYSKPLDVRWLCRPCHLAEHRAETSKADAVPLRSPQTWLGQVQRVGMP